MKAAVVTNTFLGVDLGWYGKPTGLASIVWDGEQLSLRKIARLESVDEIMAWIVAEAGCGSAVAAIDAPLVIRNQTGIRAAERLLNSDFRRFHAGCHAANLGLPFAQHVTSFSRRLEALGFAHGAATVPRPEGRFQIEVHPHAASVSLFGLDRIVKYKRGTRAQRAAGLRQFRRLLISRLPTLDPALAVRLPTVPVTGAIKPTEDKIDAVLCAYVAAHWWFHATLRNTVYGDAETGYIVVPCLRPPLKSGCCQTDGVERAARSNVESAVVFASEGEA